jgi:two-component system nitrogen regulation sensor histidine kinase NtrY
MKPNQVFKNFRISLLIRLLVIILNGTALLWIITHSEFWMLVFWLALLELILVAEMIRYIEKFKYHIITFLESIEQQDYSFAFTGSHTKRIDGRFASLFNSIIRQFQKLRSEKETKHFFLQTVIEQVSVGIIAYDKDKEVRIINETAKSLIGKPFIKKIDSIQKFNPSLYEELIQLDSHEGVIAKYEQNGQLMQVLLRATEIKSENEYLKLITIQDIRNELDEKELESWQKLIRIINHEVMNSMIPLSTLTNVNKSVLEEIRSGGDDGKTISLEEDRLKEVIEGMEIIEHRSEGIMEFVKSVKSLTNISKPQFRKIKINELLNRVYTLLNPEFEKQDINLVLRQPKDQFHTMGDLELLEQVLINLLKNAREAFSAQNEKEFQKVVLSASRIDKTTVITVEDNGSGIPKKVLENIFVPFYTTKKGGSGIGLALSRQIMRLHKGQLICQSEEGKGTIFTLRF